MKQPSGVIKLSIDDGGEKILERLKQALKADGDFPVRAKVVNELRALASSPNTKIDQISDLILREPSLGTRVLHLVNSAYYARAVPILTVRQSVLQLGMRSLTELCSGFVLMQKFVPAAQRGGVFASSVRRTIATALVCNKLTLKSETDGVAEKGYLAGTFLNLGYLLLAYYFPQVYEAAAKRALSRGFTTTRSVTEVLGISASALSFAIIDGLNIPEMYRNILTECHKPRDQRKGNSTELELCEALWVAGRIGDVIAEGKLYKELDAAVRECANESRYSLETIVDIVDQLPEMFDKQCGLIELSFLKLPEFCKDFKVRFNSGGDATEITSSEAQQLFNRYIEDMKTAIDDQEPLSSVITYAMEALQQALHFDRVLLLYSDSEGENFLGRMSMGKPFPIDARNMRRTIDPDSPSPECKAFVDGLCEIYGDPLFEDGWPFAALPVGGPEHAKGVIYADKLSGVAGEPLDPVTHAGLALLTELLDRSVEGWE